ncbi:hypothetical protein FB451DRAFT_1176283 [Mycena latifolia]|nr:hypothetical protein FB451DRAFT_1176283 [Mycena latifolia]
MGMDGDQKGQGVWLDISSEALVAGTPEIRTQLSMLALFSYPSGFLPSFLPSFQFISIPSDRPINKRSESPPPPHPSLLANGQITAEDAGRSTEGRSEKKDARSTKQISACHTQTPQRDPARGPGVLLQPSSRPARHAHPRCAAALPARIVPRGEVRAGRRGGAIDVPGAVGFRVLRAGVVGVGVGAGEEAEEARAPPACRRAPPPFLAPSRAPSAPRQAAPHTETEDCCPLSSPRRASSARRRAVQRSRKEGTGCEKARIRKGRKDKRGGGKEDEGIGRRSSVLAHARREGGGRGGRREEGREVWRGRARGAGGEGWCIPREEGKAEAGRRTEQPPRRQRGGLGLRRGDSPVEGRARRRGKGHMEGGRAYDARHQKEVRRKGTYREARRAADEGRKTRSKKQGREGSGSEDSADA